MTDQEKRRIAVLTDDPNEAFVELRKLRAKRGGQGWDIAKVRDMADPPKTAKLYCVFREPKRVR